MWLLPAPLLFGSWETGKSAGRKYYKNFGTNLLTVT
jgi:hypothetical protein